MNGWFFEKDANHVKKGNCRSSDPEISSETLTAEVFMGGAVNQ